MTRPEFTPNNADVERNALDIAIAEAEAELLDVATQLKEFANLNRRRTILENFLKKARLLKATTPVSTPASPTEADLRAASLRDVPLWQSIAAVLTENLGPMTAPDIMERLINLGHTFTENGIETVRSAMIRRPDIFEKIGDGHYALVLWPALLKRTPATMVIEAAQAAVDKSTSNE